VIGPLNSPRNGPAPVYSGVNSPLRHDTLTCFWAAGHPSPTSERVVADEDTQGEAVADGVVVALQAGGAFGTTAAEEQQGESLDQRPCREEPDPTADPDRDEPRSRSGYDDDGASDESDEFFDVDEVGDSRFVRLLAGDEGYGPDLEKEVDVGIDGGAVSAEEAAVHVVEP